VLQNVWIIPPDSVDGFSDDFAFPLNGTAQNIIADVIIKRLPVDKSLNGICCLNNIMQMGVDISLDR